MYMQAYTANIVCPNKHQSETEKFHKGHLLESETYIGGHVECLETGVFRSDLPTSFKLDPSAYNVSYPSFQAQHLDFILSMGLVIINMTGDTILFEFQFLFSNSDPVTSYNNTSCFVITLFLLYFIKAFKK